MHDPAPPVTVRAATARDHRAVAALMPELGTQDPPLSRERYERELLPGCLVAERAGRVVGYAYFETLADSGYVRHLVADPALRRAGVGRALMGAVAARLRSGGARVWRLNVRPDNAAAIALYRALGLEPRYESTVLRFDWARIDELPSPDGPATPAPVTPADDARVEAAFDLPAGQLARARANGRVLAMLVGGPGEVLGFAAFDPGFPGAFPFRVKAASGLRALLEALRPHALPDRPRMQVVIDGHEEAVAALRAIGAERRDRILHLAGPLSRT